MKRKNLWFAGAWLMAQATLAQTPYINENFMPTDLMGTARSVGMGGSMGALGADLSSISSNPAASGLYRSSDVALSFSVLTQGNKPNLKENMTHMSFDQVGFVLSTPIMGKHVKFLNLAVNYQKKANFNHAFIADNGDTKGLSQTQQMADVINYGGYTPLGELMYNAFLVNPIYATDASGNPIQDSNGDDVIEGYDGYNADLNQYHRVTEGGISGYEINLSTNIKDRFYLGFTFGIDNVDYSSFATYSEFFIDAEGSYELYTLYNTQHISGYGLNAKLGAIVRPIDSSPFRFGFAVETPTFYNLESSVGYSIDSPFNEEGEYTYPDFYNYLPGEDLSVLPLNLRTPWRFRVALGHTVGTYLALGAEYEYADYSTLKQGYDDWEYGGGSVKDPDMNAITRQTLKGIHSLKLGLELKLTDNVSLRGGYNYYSSVYDKYAHLDQVDPSPAFNYATATDYMNKGDVNIFTAGLGYRGRHFYVDMAYKFRRQSGEFYAFDDTFSADTKLDPVNVDMNNHQVFFTLGYKF